MRGGQNKSTGFAFSVNDNSALSLRVSVLGTDNISFRDRLGGVQSKPCSLGKNARV